ncbi:hypothetical protein CRM22_007392 [Opisthorchis felineus]|uniref:PPIase FKBP-type domain-containing protein n=2 Tax=Opisthorchis felineus TaxID=147828 RepID=A0A4S2LGC0_OPIFE|nr:hypothetical protein CRM22_007392 [Opisthorchis felineus]
MTHFSKTIISPGTGRLPCEHDRIVAEVSFSIDNVPRLDRQTIVFDFGHSEDFGVVKLLDTIVETMQLDERCVAHSSTMSGLTRFERSTLHLVESEDLEMQFTVHLQDIQKLKKFWQMSESEKFEVAKVMKNRGNKLIQTSQYVRALRAYKLGIGFLQGSVSVLTLNDAQNEVASTITPTSEARQLLSLCFANAALCLLRSVASASQDEANSESMRQIIHKCIAYCQSAIDLDPTYTKSWFRLAKAHAALGEFDAAVKAGERCLREAQTSPPDPFAVELNKLLQRWRGSAFKAMEEERAAIRKAVLQKYRYADYESDDEDEIEKLPISVWSNSLAANMMSLHEELEAFGEKMPEPKTSRSGRSGHRLETIVDDDISDDAERD